MWKIVKLTQITILLIVLSTIHLAADKYDQNKPELIPGSDKALIEKCGDTNTAYIYDDYTIHEEASKDYKGSNIYVFNNHAQKDKPCNLDYKRASYVIRVGEFGGANTFIGAHQNIIFLDQWTGRNFKRLLGINVQTNSLVFLDTYAEPKIQDDTMYYYKTLKAKRKSVRDKIDCPKAREWESEGKQVLYVEKMSVNLNTTKKLSSGDFLCVPADPIESVKRSGYGH